MKISVTTDEGSTLGNMSLKFRGGSSRNRDSRPICLPCCANNLNWALPYLFHHYYDDDDDDLTTILMK